MYGPKFRFLLVISLLAFAGWAYLMVDSYLFSPQGLILNLYINGAIKVGSAFIMGYLLIYLTLHVFRFKEKRKTGFEATTQDETGTIFNFKLALTKFLPKISAVPKIEGASKLESELIGFLNSLGNWPYNIESPDTTLKDHAIKQWEAMRTLPNATQLHKVAALSQDLGKVYAYKEIKAKKGDSTYTATCPEKGGMAAVILSNMPSFRNPEEDSPLADYDKKKALLTAIRYCKDPLNIPSNCDYLAKEIYDFLNKANLKAREIAGEDISKIEPTAEEKLTLKKEITSYTPNILTRINVTNANITDSSNGFYVGKNNISVKLGVLAQELLALFTPETRNAFGLWDTNTNLKPLAIAIINTYQQNGWLVEEWEGHQAEHGMFNFQLGEVNMQKCLLINVDDPIFTETQKHLKILPPLPSMVDITQSSESQIKEVKRKSQILDSQLLEVFPR